MIYSPDSGVSHLSVSINHKGMFGGMMGQTGGVGRARRRQFSLLEITNGKSWLTSLTTTGATVTPQPSDSARD